MIFMLGELLGGYFQFLLGWGEYLARTRPGVSLCTKPQWGQQQTSELCFAMPCGNLTSSRGTEDEIICRLFPESKCINPGHQTGLLDKGFFLKCWQESWHAHESKAHLIRPHLKCGWFPVNWTYTNKMVFLPLWNLSYTPHWSLEFRSQELVNTQSPKHS